MLASLYVYFERSSLFTFGLISCKLFTKFSAIAALNNLYYLNNNLYFTCAYICRHIFMFVIIFMLIIMIPGSKCIFRVVLMSFTSEAPTASTLDAGVLGVGTTFLHLQIQMMHALGINKQIVLTG